MAFAAARPNSDTMADMNITPLVDVMLVLLVIFMVTAPLMDLRIGMDLPQQTKEKPAPPPQTLVLDVQPGDLFMLDGVSLGRDQLQATLAERFRAEPALLLKIEVNPDADYQSAATAMALAKRAGIERIGLVEP